MKCIDGNFYTELEKIWSGSPTTQTKWFTVLDLGGWRIHRAVCDVCGLLL